MTMRSHLHHCSAVVLSQPCMHAKASDVFAARMAATPATGSEALAPETTLLEFVVLATSGCVRT
eukprot:681832-Amphidinium_carterae.1